jgi:hypothetical protein
MPLGIWISLSMIHLFMAISVFFESRTIKIASFSALTLVLALLFYQSAAYHAENVNTNSFVTDQSVYVDFTKRAAESHYTFTGSRNQVPFFPFLQTIFVDTTGSPESVFIQGKRSNIALGIFYLGLLFIFFRRFLGDWESYLLILIVGFSLFVLKAGYFHPELTYYFISAIVIVLILRLLNRPNLWLSLITGVLIGILHMTKASATPLLYLFILCSILQLGFIWIMEKPSPKRLFKIAASSLILLVGFLIVVFPYIQESKEIYGRYFYNVNSTFYVWTDRWREVKEGVRQHGDCCGWPDMPEEEIPSLSKYLREHTVMDIVVRLQKGYWDELRVLWRQYSMGSFSYIYLGAGLFFSAIYFREIRELLFKYPITILFLLGYFGGYATLFAFYRPIAGQTARFLYALYIPLLFGVFYLIHTLVKNEKSFWIGNREFTTKQVWIALNILCAALITYKIIFQLPISLQRIIY